MGWCGPHIRKQYVADQKNKTWLSDGATVSVARHHAGMVTDWLMLNVAHPDGRNEKVITLLLWDGAYVKNMDAECHPYYYDVPLSWLDEIVAPTPEQDMFYDWYMQVKGTPVNRCCNCRKLDCPGHEHELIVMAAWGDWEETVPKGLVGVMACLGGRKPNGAYAGAEQHFLVPDAEYAARNTAGTFVVDTARHPVWDRTKKVAA